MGFKTFNYTEQIKVTDSNQVAYEQLKECFTDTPKPAGEKECSLLIPVLGHGDSKNGRHGLL